MANFSVTFHGSSARTAAELKALFYKLHREIASGDSAKPGTLSIAGTVTEGQDAHQITNPSTAELQAIDAQSTTGATVASSSTSSATPSS